MSDGSAMSSWRWSGYHDNPTTPLAIDRVVVSFPAKVNSKKQFMESQDFQAAVTEAVVSNQEAHSTMADYFFSDGPGISAVIMALADAFYEAAIDQQTDA